MLSVDRPSHGGDADGCRRAHGGLFTGAEPIGAVHFISGEFALEWDFY
jgi:hypothetical protein